MKVASEVAKDGMSAKGEMLTFISDLIAKEGITKIIETGTYLGTGTTMAVVDGLTKHGKDFTFYSIEVNPSHYRQAKRNVPRLRGINIINGLSIGHSDLPTKVSFKGYPDEVIVDHHPENREQLYLNETAHNVSDNLLEDCLADFNYKPELVILDSAGHIGEIEYKYLMERVKGEFYLVLDDTNHVKHYKTAQDVNEKYEVIFKTESKFGGLCAKVSPL